MYHGFPFSHNSSHTSHIQNTFTPRTRYRVTSHYSISSNLGSHHLNEVQVQMFFGYNSSYTAPQVQFLLTWRFVTKEIRILPPQMLNMQCTVCRMRNIVGWSLEKTICHRQLEPSPVVRKLPLIHPRKGWEMLSGKSLCIWDSGFSWRWNCYDEDKN